MVWTQVSTNRWERPLDGLESYFVLIANMSAGLCDGREHYTISATLKVEIDSADVISELRQAWKQLRYEQPQIATAIEGMTRVYTVPDEKSLEDWLNETFIVSNASSAEEMRKDIKPIKQTTLYYIPASSELVFRGQHYTADGTGMELLCHSFLSALANPKKEINFGSEAERLAPVLEETLGFSADSTSVKQKAQELLGIYVEGQPAIGPVSKLCSAPSGNPRNAELVFPPDMSALLFESCQDQNITVTSAVHAAYVRTIMKYADPTSDQSRYTTTNQFNVRPYLPEPYNSSQYAASSYYITRPYRVGLPASYWELVESFGKFYESHKTGFGDDPETLEVDGYVNRGMQEFVSSPEFASAPARSLGIVENHINREYGAKIEVKDFKFGVDVVLGMSIFFTYTFQTKLRLVYSFNDGFEKLEDIMMYLKKVQWILVQELLL